MLSQVANPIGNRLFRDSDRAEGRRLLQRVLNQNEQSTGLFFLQADAEAGIAEPAVAFLRVTVSLRADHYEALLAASVGALTSEFRAKLGWLIGNLYVRPATRDWSDVEGGKKKADDLVSQYLDEAKWIDDEIVDQARANGVDVARAAPSELEALRPPSPLDKALDEIGSELHRVVPAITPEDVKKVKNRYPNTCPEPV